MNKRGQAGLPMNTLIVAIIAIIVLLLIVTFFTGGLGTIGEKIREIFGAGTAAVISPVGKIKYGDQEITINNNQTGPFAQKYYTAITDIQYGKAEDPMGWIEPVA